MLAPDSREQLMKIYMRLPHGGVGNLKLQVYHVLNYADKKQSLRYVHKIHPTAEYVVVIFP